MSDVLESGAADAPAEYIVELSTSGDVLACRADGGSILDCDEDEPDVGDWLDCVASGDVEPAIRYLLSTYRIEFRIVAKDDSGEYVNRLATADEKREACESIYFESECDFSDESQAERHLIWQAASEVQNEQSEREYEAERIEAESPWKVETATAPASWASYFINGDSSGIEDDSEIAAADAFLARLGWGSPTGCEDAGFIAFHDARAEFPLAADCQTYSFLVPKDAAGHARVTEALAAMRAEPETLPVLFRMAGSRGEPKQCVAVFPTLVGTDTHDVTVYQHIGQHGSAHRGWYNGTRRATPAEFAELKAELDSIYAPEYRLKIVQRWTRHHDATRRAEFSRIRQG